MLYEHAKPSWKVVEMANFIYVLHYLTSLLIIRMKVISVNVGIPRKIEWNGQQIETSIFKYPVEGKVRVRRLNLDGDVQADKAAHGGEHRALMVYQKESYEFWRQKLLRNDLQYGQFGENLTVEGLADEDVCIGDRYQIGTAIFEVTQPRVTCFKVGISIGVPEMPALLVAQRRPGFYFRVIEEGQIAAGDEIYKVADGAEHMSVADIDALLYSALHPADKLEKALKIPALSLGWHGSFRDLEDGFKQGIAGNRGLSGQTQTFAWSGFRQLIVMQIKQESLGILSFKLGAADSASLPTYFAGQYIALRLPAGPGKKTIIRMYSLCGPPDSGYYRIAVKLEGGPGSSYMHQQIQLGELLEASAPRGNFILSNANAPLILLSAGVGITPILAMLHSLAHKANRKIWWVHSARDSAHHSFAAEIKELMSTLSSARIVTLYSRPSDQDRSAGNFDYEGRVTAALFRELEFPSESECYLCGPTSYMRELTQLLEDEGIDKKKIFNELFENDDSTAERKAPHPPNMSAGTGPQITFMKSKVSFAWDMKCHSLLEAAEACDVPVSWSCRTGVCHRCESSLVDGQVSYFTEPLDAPAEGNILICCAKPVTDIVLDL